LAYELWLEVQRRGRRRRRNHMEEERESSGQTLTSRVVQQGVQSVSTIQINKK